MASPMANLRKGKTVTGLSYYDIPVLHEEGINGYLETYQGLFFQRLTRSFPGDDSGANSLIRRMQKFTNVGEFLDDGMGQRTELAAFGVVLVDRFSAHAKAGADGWKSYDHWFGITECLEYVQGATFYASRAALKRHAENHAMRDQAVAYYAANSSRFASLDAAAAAIARKIVPVSFRTVRDWLAKHRKELRSARRL